MWIWSYLNPFITRRSFISLCVIFIILAWSELAGDRKCWGDLQIMLLKFCCYVSYFLFSLSSPLGFHFLLFIPLFHWQFSYSLSSLSFCVVEFLFNSSAFVNFLFSSSFLILNFTRFSSRWLKGDNRSFIPDHVDERYRCRVRKPAHGGGAARGWRAPWICTRLQCLFPSRWVTRGWEEEQDNDTLFMLPWLISSAHGPALNLLICFDSSQHQAVICSPGWK